MNGIVDIGWGSMCLGFLLLLIPVTAFGLLSYGIGEGYAHCGKSDDFAIVFDRFLFRIFVYMEFGMDQFVVGDCYDLCSFVDGIGAD